MGRRGQRSPPAHLSAASCNTKLLEDGSTGRTPCAHHHTAYLLHHCLLHITPLWTSLLVPCYLHVPTPCPCHHTCTPCALWDPCCSSGVDLHTIHTLCPYFHTTVPPTPSCLHACYTAYLVPATYTTHYPLVRCCTMPCFLSLPPFLPVTHAVLPGLAVLVIWFHLLPCPCVQIPTTLFGSVIAGLIIFYSLGPLVGWYGFLLGSGQFVQ